MEVENSVKSSTSGGKESKKDRHMKLLNDLSKFLENTNEGTVQSVLLLRRTVREDLEELDEDLQKFCARIDENSFLLDKSEDQLVTLLEELKGKILHREAAINKLQFDLDETEVKRAAVVGKELKILVDKLVAIGHQLPDDIERLVENEAFEINKEVINNRMEHAKFVADLRVRHVQFEYELIERWEGTRRKWRQLRHDQALTIFQQQITSDEYNNPKDRQQYMETFRNEQLQRRKVMEEILEAFQKLQYATVTIEQVNALQQRFNTCNENELAAVQRCYNGLMELRGSADYFVKERIEELRKELHVYGALKVDPKLLVTAKQLETCVNDTSLSELFRLGGGLKPDLQTLISEMTSDEVVYDRVVLSMQEKLAFIMSSFTLKSILEEKGRLIQLEKIRGMIMKMRNSPRQEIPGLLKSLMPEIDEVSKMDKIPSIFLETVQTTIREMEEEFVALEKRIAQNASAVLASTGTSLRGTQAFSGTNNSKAGTASATSLGNGNTSKAVVVSRGGNDSTSTKSRGGGGGGGTLSRTGGTRGKTSGGPGGSTVTEVMTYVDPVLLKQWHRKLAILFYGSDLPVPYQSLCLEIFEQVQQQLECNRLVDEVIHRHSTDQARIMDLRYGKMIDYTCSFLENQTNYLYTQTMNISNFYLTIAAQLEKHRQEQTTIDNKSADELWDLREDFRFKLEDLETEYQQYCQQIRESTKAEQIAHYFAKVLEVLDKIQETYRLYHKQACFTADRYPVYAIDEYRRLLVKFASHLSMHPKRSHHIFQQYHRLFDQTIRLNATFFEDNPDAAGVIRVSDEDLLQLGTTEYVADEEYESPNGENEEDYQSTQAFSGSFQMLLPFEKFLQKFCEDSAFVYVPIPADNPTGTIPSTIERGNALTENNPEVEDKPLITAKFTPHAQYPFLKEETTIFPKTAEELDQMLPEDREVYEKQLVKFFLPIEDLSILTSEEARQQYEAVSSYVSQLKERFALEASSDYLRSHVPIDPLTHQSWVCTVEITNNELEQLVETIRDNVIRNVEIESMKKVLTVEHDMINKKDELTNELEDRIRNHWPRRGRVETEIKQPRETEILAHKDKTYRIILNLQGKMAEIQGKFYHLYQAGQQACEAYRSEIGALTTLVRNDYKNLAALQGIDVKARGVTLDFQAANQQQIVALQKVLSQEIPVVITTAKDFRKICPLQQPGVEGGYSESELQEIEVLITNQLQEIDEISQTWTQEIHQLSEAQIQSLQVYEAFTKKYQQCVQEVAMAEGLGQKYGAPRRRAQERIRTEISLDERKSGKVDEFIAQIDFLAAEIHLSIQGDPLVLFEESTISSHALPGPPANNTTTLAKTTTTMMATASSTTVIAAPAMNSIQLISQGIDNIKNCQLLWQLCKVLKELLLKRVTFLNVIGEAGYPMTVETLPWFQEQRFYELNELVPSSSGNSHTLVAPGKTTTALHHDHFLAEMKQILQQVVDNSIVVEAIPSNPKENATTTGNVSPRTAAVTAGKGGGKGAPNPAATASTSTANNSGSVIRTIEIVYEEINQNCRKETKQLYESEGLTSALTSKNGVPESLEHWLEESHHKIFGRYGYREKAWKRLWGQVERLDLLLIRNRNLSQDSHHNPTTTTMEEGAGVSRPGSPEVPQTSPTTHKKTKKTAPFANSVTASHQTVSIPAAVPPPPPAKPSIQSALFYYFTKSMISFSQYDYQIKYQELETLLMIWNKSKEKNERLLRPRLSSPDRQDELSQLDQTEMQRSQELTNTTIQFRNFMIRKQIHRFRGFIDDLIAMTKGLMYYIDSIIRLEVLALPPDTEIPKKHLTLKKLRKAQRIREEVAKGGVDRSKKRAWPMIEIQEICRFIKEQEDLVTDLGKDATDFTGGLDGSNSNPPATDGGKGKAPPPAKKGSEKNPSAQAVAAATANPSLVPDVWIEKMREISVVEGLVSSAQRVVIEERILAIQRYQEYLKYFFTFIREEFDRILKQEQSWNERWKRQVEMLRNGSNNNLTE